MTVCNILLFSLETMRGSLSKAFQRVIMMLLTFQLQMVSTMGIVWQILCKFLVNKLHVHLVRVGHVTITCWQVICDCFHSSYTCSIELSPYMVSEAFYNGELENELRRIERVEYTFKRDSDRETCMQMVEEVRRKTVYPHNVDDCTEECKKRGIQN